MDALEATNIIQEFLVVALQLTGPAVCTSLIVGVIISIFQTLTSIQEQTLTFAPRILAVGVVFGFTATWTLGVLIEFTRRYFERLAEIGIAS